jgi:hypothetical protein
MSIFCIALPALVLLHSPNSWKFTVIAVVVVAVGAALAWARRCGLRWDDTVRVLFAATWSPAAWSEPSIARLLTSRERVRQPDASSAADHRRAIVELAALLPESLARSREQLPPQALHLQRLIAQRSAEAAALARDGSAAEVDRLEAQIAAFDAEPTRGGADREELIALLRRQLDLVRGMRVRAVLVAQDRARLFALMRGLWTQLRVIVELPADHATPSAEIDRLSALHEEIERELAAIESSAR